MATLPPFTPYPVGALRQHLTAADWDSLYQAWNTLSQSFLALPEAEFNKKIKTDQDSLVEFLSSFLQESAQLESPSPSPPPQLLKTVFQLISRILSPSKSQPPALLLTFSFLADFSRLFPKKRVELILGNLLSQQNPASSTIETSISTLKKLLIPNLDAGIKGDVRLVESQLNRLHPLLHASPQICTLVLAGSDFFDGLVTCFRVMNPPLRKAIVTTAFLCIRGLTESDPPKWSMLSDQLYALKDAAEAHQVGPLNSQDSLVVELVSSSPLLKILSHKIESAGTASMADGLRKRITALEPFRTGPMVRPKRKTTAKSKSDSKGKGRETADQVQAELHVHRAELISQVQDLFPDLGSGFVAKCLDEYGENVELVVANLLGESLPSHLASADRSEPLSFAVAQHSGHSNLAPRSTPPPPASYAFARHNIHDDDDFDRLAISTSKLSFGKKPAKDADALLQESTSLPAKAAILSALAAFDSDDDERDDTYDADDVGGVVGVVDASANQGEANGATDHNEETLFRAYQLDGGKVFARDAAVRRSGERKQLRDETGMTDEAIEGWAVMLSRNAQQRRRLEAKYAFAGEQRRLEATSWRAGGGASGSGSEDGEYAAGTRGRGGGGPSRGRGRGGRGRGGGRGGGDVAGPPGQKDTQAARRRKEANKGSRAREGRARKMARAGFAG